MKRLFLEPLSDTSGCMRSSSSLLEKGGIFDINKSWYLLLHEFQVFFSSLRWYREVRKRNIGKRWDGGVEEEVVWRYWSGRMKRKMRLELEMEGRCVWGGEEFVADYVEEELVRNKR